MMKFLEDVAAIVFFTVAADVMNAITVALEKPTDRQIREMIENEYRRPV